MISSNEIKRALYAEHNHTKHDWREVFAIELERIEHDTTERSSNFCADKLRKDGHDSTFNGRDDDVRRPSH